MIEIFKTLQGTPKTLPGTSDAPAEISLPEIKAILLNKRARRRRDKKNWMRVAYDPLELGSWQNAVRAHLIRNDSLRRGVVTQVEGFARKDQSLTNHLATLVRKGYIKPSGGPHHTKYSATRQITYYQDPDFSSTELARLRTVVRKFTADEVYPRSWHDSRGSFFISKAVNKDVPPFDMARISSFIEHGVWAAIAVWQGRECINHLDDLMRFDERLNEALLKIGNPKVEIIQVATDFWEGYFSRDSSNCMVTRPIFGRYIETIDPPLFIQLERDRQTGKISNKEYRKRVHASFSRLRVVEKQTKRESQDFHEKQETIRLEEDIQAFYSLMGRKGEELDRRDTNGTWVREWRALIRPFPFVMIDSPVVMEQFEKSVFVWPRMSPDPIYVEPLPKDLLA